MIHEIIGSNLFARNKKQVHHLHHNHFPQHYIDGNPADNYMLPLIIWPVKISGGREYGKQIMPKI